MNPIKYQLKSFNENYNLLRNTGRGYCKLFVFIDYMGCLIKYKASAADYFEYEFYDKKRRKREEFACWGLKKKFFHKMNDYTKSSMFNDKVEFLKKFSDYVGREYLFVPESSEQKYKDFCCKHRQLIVKPTNASCGRGVELVDSEEIMERYQEFVKEQMLIEEVIIQHPEMSRLYSGAVNTIRVATVLINGNVNILGATLRCGSGEGCIDNYCAGGIATRLDVECGCGISDGINVRHERFPKHPDSGVCLHGFRVPHWDKVIDLVTKAACVVPGVKYTGWDVAIRKDDVVLVEGNFEGMFNVLQQPGDKGLKTVIVDIMKECK